MNSTNDSSDCGSSLCRSEENASNWDHDTSIYDGAWVLGYKLTE